MKNLLHEIRSQYDSFSRVEKKIADFVLTAPETAIHMTMAQLAAETGVSEGSVNNFANRLGFKGFKALKLGIAQSVSNQEEILLRHIEKNDGPHTVLTHLVQEIRQGFDSTSAANTEENLKQAAELLAQAGRIEIYGVGTSAVIASDAYYRLMRQGFPAYAETDPHIASVSASFLDEKSVVIAISHSGRTIETLQAVRIAKEQGARIIALTSYPDSPLTACSDTVLLSTSREAAEWKEALVSRYSQLLLLDALMLYLSLKDMDRTLQYMENVVDIIGEHRISSK